MIGDIFDATNDVRSARSVYLSLTEFASDAQSNTFSQSVANIARRAGVSYRTCFEVLKRFEALKILAVKRNRLAGTKERSPSTYTLCNGCTTLCNKAVAESIEKSKKKFSLHDLPRKDIICRVRKRLGNTPNGARATARSSSFSSSETKARGNSLVRYTSEERAAIAEYHRVLVPLGFRPVNKFTQAVRDAIDCHSEEEWRDVFRDVADTDPSEWPKRKTLVRLNWHLR